MARGGPDDAPAPGRGLALGLGALITVIGLVLFASALGSLPIHRARAAQAITAPRAAAPIPVERTCDEDMEELRLGLRGLRAGEEPDRNRLAEVAGRLATNCGRMDAVRATEHLTSLTPSEARVAEAAIDKILGTLDSYEEAEKHKDSSRRDEMLRTLESMTGELDRLADPLPAAYAQRVLADLHLLSGDDADPERAASLAGRALEVYSGVGFHEQEVEALEVLARAHLEIADWHSARVEAARGLELARHIGDALYESLFLGILVRVADLTGAGLEREHLLREWGALSRDHRLCGIEEWWTWTQETVTWLTDEDHPKQALSFLHDAMDERREETGVDPLGAPNLRRQARTLEAMVLIRTGEFERATELLNQGATYDERARLLRAYLGLRRLLDADEAESRAIVSELAVLLAEDWVRDLSPELRDVGEIYTGEYHMRRGEHELAKLTLERVVQRALERERELAPRSTLDKTASLGGESLGLHAVQLLVRTDLVLERPLLAAHVCEELQARSLRPRSCVLQESDLLAWAADSDLGLVTWVIGPDEGVAIWVDEEGGVESKLIPHGRRAVQRAVERLRQAYRDERTDDAAWLGAELARDLLPLALRERLSSCRGESLLLLAHGPLALLPMGALYVSDSDDSEGVLLCEAATLRVLPGLPAAHPEDATVEGSEWVLLGAPTDEQGHTRLPGAREELDGIAERRSCRMLAGAEMNRAAMVSALEGDACLHVATHVEWVTTEFGPTPALELAGGAFFSVRDLPDPMGPRELVILAGCESAGGRVLDGEGVLGFAHAFLESGTRGVVATLWPVRDEAAREFGIALHEGLLMDRPPSIAVRRACLRLREAGLSDWAAFQLLGRD